ncbi:hypothetical protein ACLKA7_004971 [Drosophila subpalustris]
MEPTDTQKQELDVLRQIGALDEENVCLQREICEKETAVLDLKRQLQKASNEGASVDLIEEQSETVEQLTSELRVLHARAEALVSKKAILNTNAALNRSTSPSLSIASHKSSCSRRSSKSTISNYMSNSIKSVAMEQKPAWSEMRQTQAASIPPDNQQRIIVNMLARQSLNNKHMEFVGSSYLAWRQFKAQFTSSSVECGFSGEEDVYRLNKALKGQCTQRLKCNIDNCERFHHRLLHKPKTTEPTTRAEFSGCVQENTQQVLLKMVPVTVHGPNGEKKILAFLDEGSTTTMLDMSIAREVGILGKEEPFCFGWTGGLYRYEQNAETANIQISGNSQTHNLQNVRLVKDLDLPTQQINYQEIQEQYPYAKMANLHKLDNPKPMLLIGQQHGKLITSQSVINTEANGPIMSKTKLGWVMHGPVKSKTAGLNFACCHITDDHLKDMLQSQFSLEGFGVCTTKVDKTKSADEQMAINKIASPIIKRGEETFVANRIGEICEKSKRSEWNWVPTDDNIADIITRDVNQKQKLERWIKGPKFLESSEQAWPAQANKAQMDVVMVVQEQEDALEIIALAEALEELNEKSMKSTLAAKGINWNFIPANSPNFGGCWERLIGCVKRTLEAVFSVNTNPTDETLRTVFCEAEHLVNSRPYLLESDDPDDGIGLCPNDIIMQQSVSIHVPCHNSESLEKRTWRATQVLIECFWKRFLKEYLPTLVNRPKWTKDCQNLRDGEIVVIRSPMPRGDWPLGIVLKTFPGEDNVVRVAEVKTANNVFRRPVSSLCRLQIISDRHYRVETETQH